MGLPSSRRWLTVGYRFNVERWADFRELVPAGADQLVEMLEDELATLAIGGNVDAQQHPELTHVLAEAFHHHRFTAKTVDVQQREGAGWTTRVLRGRHYDPWLATGDPTQTRDAETPPHLADYIHARRHGNGYWTTAERHWDSRTWRAFKGGFDNTNDPEEVGTADTLHEAEQLADAAVHVDCGAACGEWRPYSLTVRE